MEASISRFSFFPSLNWLNVAQFILYSVFQGSNDGKTWTTLATIDQTVHTGWNVFASKDTSAYRYIRYLHNSTSKCSLAEIKLYGILYSKVDANLDRQPADFYYNDGYNKKLFKDYLFYTTSFTPVVTSVSPRYGSPDGNYPLILTGSNLGFDPNIVILIDGVLCAFPVASDTEIKCTVGKRTTTPKVANNFTVIIGGSNAVLQDSFIYALSWSSTSTWGVDSIPIDKDLVYVPLGTTLLVDVDTPILEGIAVEGGTLVFSD